VGAPPNPYLFYNYNSVTGSWAPKTTASEDRFREALDYCCFVRDQSVLQEDGIEFVLAIKIDFSDQPGQRSGATLDRYLFADEGVSLKTYYDEVSYGQMDIRPGPMGGVVPRGNQWIRAQHPMSYYGEGRINVKRSRELVREACAAVDATVDFSAYDRDKDGVVDHVFIIHSGDDQASTLEMNDIWSILTNNVNRVFDGVLVSTAVLVGEEPSFDTPHLGIYFHEFLHDFGAPDVYGGNFVGPLDHKWGLMGQFGPYQGEIVNGIGNGLKPSHISGYLKWDFDARPENGRLGWIQPVEIKENVSNLSIPSFELPPAENKLFKVNIPGKINQFGESTEFFLIENRHKESGARFDTRLPESGILIWHIDETKVRPAGVIDAASQIWLEDPNDPKHYGITPNQSHIIDIGTITDGAAYSADDGEISFTPATSPNSNANDGTVSRISITNIGLEGQEITLSIAFGDTYEPNDELDEAFPIQFNQTYESFIFDQKDKRDLYRTDAISGEAIVATLLNPSDTVDYELSILNESGQQIATAERVSPTELQIILQPTQTGRFYISVESQSGFSEVDSYLLTVNAVEPQSGQLKLEQVRAFPNPIRAEHHAAFFFYTVPDLQLAEEVKLEIFNIAGDLVYTDVQSNVIGSGHFRWNGKNAANEIPATGIYIFAISAVQGENVVREVGKISLVR
jgi:M6 family metalloprotease-like protein